MSGANGIIIVFTYIALAGGSRAVGFVSWNLTCEWDAVIYLPKEQAKTENSEHLEVCFLLEGLT